MSGLPCFLGDVPSYFCDDSGRVHIVSGDFALVTPQHIFLEGCARGKAAVIAWQKRERAKHAVVIPIEKLRGH